MKRPPRPLSQRIFDPRTIGISVLQGVGILLSVVILLLYVLHSGKSDIEARTMAFSALVIANVLLIVTNLSWSENFIQILSRHNRALWSVIVGTFAALIIILVVPFARSLFHFSQLHTNDVIIVSAVAVVSVVWFEVIKKSRFLRC
jgi:Ca2+-transporting ATPase